MELQWIICSALMKGNFSKQININLYFKKIYKSYRIYLLIFYLYRYWLRRVGAPITYVGKWASKKNQ